DRALEETMRAGNAEQRRDLRAAARVAEDGDVRGIATECGGVVANPLERELHILHTRVAGSLEAFAADLGEIEVAEDIQAMVDRHDDQIAARGQPRTVIEPFGSGAGVEPAAVKPDHYRTALGVSCRCPHVEDETVLAGLQKRTAFVVAQTDIAGLRTDVA